MSKKYGKDYRIIIEDIKEKYCYVSDDLEKDLKFEPVQLLWHELPDGTIISIDQERFKYTEAFFNPSLIDKQFSGIQEQIYQSIKNSDIDLRKIFLNNIILSGGNTCMKNLHNRLSTEIKKLLPQNYKELVRINSGATKNILHGKEDLYFQQYWKQNGSREMNILKLGIQLFIENVFKIE